MIQPAAKRQGSIASAPAAPVGHECNCEFRELESATLLVHIAFHFVEGRLRFLREVLTEFREYRLRMIEIVVDTNDEATLKALGEMDLGRSVAIKVRVHRDLKHPFLLTWQHREAFAERQQAFDYYLYLEDDIRVPWTTFAPWAMELPILDQRGWLRGVLRVEPDHKGRLMASDWYRPMRRPVVYEIDGRRYVRPEEPYQACWCCTGDQLRRFVESETWRFGAHRWSHVRSKIPRFSDDWFIRERASLGPIYAAPFMHRLLLPIGESCEVLQSAFVDHLPANYARDARSRYAKIEAKHLLRGKPVREGSVRAIWADLSRELLFLGMRVTGPHPIRAVRSWLSRVLKASTG